MNKIGSYAFFSLVLMYFFYLNTNAALPYKNSAYPEYKLKNHLQRTLGGTLKNDTVLDAAEPWQVISDLILPAGITLTVEAGAEVYFDHAAGLYIQKQGRLLILGQTGKRVVLTATQPQSDRWDGITFDHSLEENQLVCVDMLRGDRQSHAIYVNESRVYMDNMTWSSSNKTVVEVNHPSLIIRNCTFPEVESVEIIHGQYLTGDEYFILDGNTFGKTKGYNDVIDFSGCRRPGPIFQAYNNTFLGGSDDGLDMDGCDAHIEGNVFMHFHKDNTSSSTSNAIATGLWAESGNSTDITVVRNIFYDNDHAILLKEDCSADAENNVFVHCSKAAINFSEWPDRTVAPGKGAYLDGNIFWDNPVPFDNQFAQPGHADPVIIVNRCIIPAAMHGLGTGNLDLDPLFVDSSNDFHLQPASPAIGTGPNGLDIGRYVNAGASISGEPDAVSSESSAILTIAGPGITQYQYKVNNLNDPWSEEFAIKDDPHIQLTNLSNGMSFTVYVRGKNSADAWQTDPEYATSKTWRVQTSFIAAADRQLPERCCLNQNYPNPFNPATVISFTIARQCHVTLNIFDVNANLVQTLADDDYEKGEFKIKWDAGQNASGVYLVRLTAGSFVDMTKVMLLK